MGADGHRFSGPAALGAPLWPAIWLGAFVANAGTEAPLWTAAAVATGNTLEAVAAAWILRRIPGFDPTLRRVRDAVAFIVVAAVMSTAISATIGVTTLCAAAVQPWTRFSALWSDWWLGDALGALVVAPVILTTVRTPAAWSRRDWVETCLLVVGTAAISQVVFGQVFGPAIGHHPLEYVIFPFVITAAVRLGQPAAALVVLGASGVTIWNTVRGAGPFAGSGRPSEPDPPAGRSWACWLAQACSSQPRLRNDGRASAAVLPRTQSATSWLMRRI